MTSEVTTLILLKDTLQSVQAATEADREIDEAILRTLGFEQHQGRWYLNDLLTQVDPFSGSLDSVTCLIKCKLNAGWMVSDVGFCRATIYFADGDVKAEGATPALALLAAYLRAQIKAFEKLLDLRNEHAS